MRRYRSTGNDSSSGRRFDNENYVVKGIVVQKLTGDERHQGRAFDEDQCEENKHIKDYKHKNSGKWDTESDEEL